MARACKYGSQAMGRRRRKRIAWVWSISYTFASACLAGAVWGYLSFLFHQALLDAHGGVDFSHSARPESLPGGLQPRQILALGARALVFVLVLALPGFEMNQQIWAALRARPRRVRGVAIYGWKLLVLNGAILLAGPIGASLQFYLSL